MVGPNLTEGPSDLAMVPLYFETLGCSGLTCPYTFALQQVDLKICNSNPTAEYRWNICTM